MEIYFAATIFLLLCQVYVISSFPLLPDSGEENDTMSGSGSDEDSQLDTSTSRDVPPLNNYIVQFFQSQRVLKESNCTVQFLGQSVSEHLCNSNSVKFLFPHARNSSEFLSLYCFIAIDLHSIFLYMYTQVLSRMVLGTQTQIFMNCALVR